MKHPKVLTIPIAAIVGCMTMSSALSMPLHPDVVKKILAEKTQGPALMEEERKLRERGVNVPFRVQRICDIASGRTKDTFNALAVLVDFDDNTASVNPAFFDTLLYEEQTGTLTDYWQEVTYGNLTITTLDLPGALGWKRAPQDYAYYVNGQKGFGTYPHNAQKLAEDAVVLADPFVDFSDYDNDSDGYVDGLFVIHAGPGYEWTGKYDHIHSHAWHMHTPQYVDGVVAYGYSMEPEYWSNPGDMTCGVYAHEMGHAVFGLPDLYDYDYDSNGLGKWSLMAGGSWNGPKGASPAHPDAWCRLQTEAASPTILSSNLPGATLPAINTTPVIYRLWTDGAGGSQFFLVENRRKMGYDAYLPSQGLLIYHVDETQSGNDDQWYPPSHTEYGNYLVALEQADGQWWLEKNFNSGDIKDPYPGGTNNRAFDATSWPDSKDYDFNDTKVAVRNISDSDSIMTADLYVADVAPPEAIDDLAATLTRGSSKSKSSTGDVHLSWTEPYAEGGVSYYVVYRSTVPAVAGDSLAATTDTSYADLGAVGDTTTNHYYTVEAVDDFGSKSTSSNQVGEFDIYLMTAE